MLGVRAHYLLFDRTRIVYFHMVVRAVCWCGPGFPRRPGFSGRVWVEGLRRLWREGNTRSHSEPGR
jgi:hypothetical protein